MGCMWMRQVRVRVGANHNSLLLSNPSMASLSPPMLPSPISSSFPKPPSSLISLVFYHRRSLSTAACSPPIPHVSIHDNCSDFDNSVGVGGGIGVSRNGSKLFLKGMRYSELESWVQLEGYRPGQALMLWKRLYGNNV